jgi:hypothetical protein
LRGEGPKVVDEKLVDRVRLRAFRPLDASEDDEQRAGWVAIDNPFDFEIDRTKMLYGPYLNLGLRVDRWRIPGPLFKAHFAEAERAHLAERGREKLSRREKDELKTFVQKRLRKMLVPSMKVVDMSWNLDTGVIRFWSNAPALHDILGEIFSASFGHSFVPESPYTAGAALGLSDAELDAFDRLDPTIFHAVPQAEG